MLSTTEDCRCPHTIFAIDVATQREQLFEQFFTGTKFSPVVALACCNGIQ